MIADFVAEGSGDSFAVCVHPRRLGRAGEDVHVLGLENGVDGGWLLPVAVVELEAERA
ncbi:hypothetical protein [Saccharopolyspora spinosa]|uniref:hypothetical protein n=1 Tax=Saccharopolyspora spinosa TaxID=60894 RepID=UPI001472DA2A|nr:hypothetical protein [Saccharopolyspora spinosa]